MFTVFHPYLTSGRIKVVNIPFKTNVWLDPLQIYWCLECLIHITNSAEEILKILIGLSMLLKIIFIYF